MVLRNGKVAYLDAVGHRDVEAGDVMEVDDIFRIASQTKALTSVAVMMLVEEGRVGLSDPVARFLPAFEKTTVAVPSEGSGTDGRSSTPSAPGSLTSRMATSGVSPPSSASR